MILLIIWIVIAGLIIGALGRLVIPGPNPMSIPMTILADRGTTPTPPARSPPSSRG